MPHGSAGDRLLDRLGYRVRWTSWILHLPPAARIPPREVPDGYAIRAATTDDYRDAHRVLADAFGEWSVRHREPYADFLAVTVQRPGFRTRNLRVAIGPSGDIVGVVVVILGGDASTEAFVDRVAVRRDHRRRGLAQALLADAFAAGRDDGASRFGLATDSRTGALDLYLKLGMRVDSVWLNRAIDL